MIQYGLASSDASPPRTYASLVASLSPIAWWRSFSGATWTDASGNGYHATLIGNPSIVTGIPGAAADGAASLDGAGQYGQGPLVPQGNYFAIVAWVQGGSLSGRIASNRYDTSNVGFDWYVYNTNRIGMYVPNGPWLSGSMAYGNLIDDAWHMLAYSCDSVSASLWIDGAMVSRVSAGPAGVSSQSLILGGQSLANGLAPTFNGNLAEVSIHPPLTVAQIAQLWAAGISG